MAKKAKAKSKSTARSTASENGQSPAPWTKTRPECSITFFILKRRLEQFSEKFAGAGKLKMPQLRFWSQVASADLRRVDAGPLALVIDHNCMDQDPASGFQAQYEPGFNRATALMALQNGLTNEEHTVADIARLVDKIYRFKGEAPDPDADN